MSRSPTVHGPLNIHLPAWCVNPNLHRSTFMLICCKHFMFKSVYTLFPDVVMAATNLLSLSNRSLALPLMSHHLFESCMNASLIRSWWFQYLLIFLFIYTWTFTICHTRWMSANHFFLISCKSHTSINVLVLKPETCTVRMVSMIWMIELDTSRVVTTTPFSDAGTATVPPSVRLSHRPTNHPPSFTHRPRLVQPLTGRGRPSSRYGH